MKNVSHWKNPLPAAFLVDAMWFVSQAMVSVLLLGMSYGLTHQCNLQSVLVRSEIHRLFTSEIKPGQTLVCSTVFLKPLVKWFKIVREQIQLVCSERFTYTVKVQDLTLWKQTSYFSDFIYLFIEKGMYHNIVCSAANASPTLNWHHHLSLVWNAKTDIWLVALISEFLLL